jgi:regulator of ribonuclease activity A
LLVCDAYLPLKSKISVLRRHFRGENAVSSKLQNSSMSNVNTLKFATCDLCDAHKNDASGNFRVLPPVFKNYGKYIKFCGEVVTIKCFEDNSLVKAAVDSAGEGCVLVVDGGASLRRALLGGNLGTAAAKNNWAGVVIDGCVRDVAELAQNAVGIRALAAMPLPTDKRGEGQRDVAVQIQGVWVRPGDWLYADEDGMVVMPAPTVV